jgi:HD superfamily phosphohydrolase
MRAGGPDSAPSDWKWTGRGAPKQFLFEIVANKRNGIDVDKFDYFARDCHQMGMKWSFDAHRLMRFARAMEVDGVMQICYQEKEVPYHVAATGACYCHWVLRIYFFMFGVIILQNSVSVPAACVTVTII